jgi:hypothetical protein
MSGSRVEASELANGRTPKDKKKAMIQVSRNQLTVALLLCLAAIIVAILITYTITKESVGKGGIYSNQSFSNGLSNYQDEFDVP